MARMSSLADFTAYWQNLGDIHEGIVQVYFHDGDRIADRARSTLRYPLLLVETPDTPVSVVEAGMQLKFSTSVTVLGKPQSEAYHHEDAVKQLTHTVLIDLLNWVVQDAQRGAFDITPSKLNPQYLGPYGGDLDCGWRTRITMEAVAGICVKPRP